MNFRLSPTARGLLTLYIPSLVISLGQGMVIPGAMDAPDKTSETEITPETPAIPPVPPLEPPGEPQKPDVSDISTVSDVSIGGGKGMSGEVI